MQKVFIKQMPLGLNVRWGKDTDWDACQRVLEDHSAWINAVVFSPDGELVASASKDSTVRVWETATGQRRSVRQHQRPPIFYTAFSSDGRTLRTNKGDIPLPLDLIALLPILHIQELPFTTVEGEWTLRQTQRFLWLPPEYRDYTAAVCGHMVCLGCISGRVALLSLQQD
jgi:hypothetical protein